MTDAALKYFSRFNLELKISIWVRIRCERGNAKSITPRCLMPKNLALSSAKMKIRTSKFFITNSSLKPTKKT